MKSEGWLPDLLPTGWKRVGAKSLFTERRVVAASDEVHLTPSQTHGVLPQAEYTAVTGNRVVAVIEGGNNMKLVMPGDFVVHLRSFQGGIEWSNHRGKVSPAYTVLTPTERIQPRFFRWVLKSNGYVQELRSTTNQMRDGQTLKFKHIAMIEYALPLLREQRAIADYLDRETAAIDALITKQQQLIEVLQERRRAAIATAALGTFEPLGGTSNSKPIGADFSVVLGKMLDAGKAPDAGSRERPYLRAANVRESGLDCSNAYSMPFTAKEAARLDLRAGDLLVVEGGATVGRTARVEHDLDGWSFQKTLNRVRSTGGASTWWLGYVLSAYRDAGVIAQITDGSTFAHLTAEKLRALRVPVVEPAEQHRIVAELDEQTALIDELIGKAEQFIALAKERRAALITAAVTGQIAVPGFDPDEMTKAA